MRLRKHEQLEVGELNIIPYLDIITNLVMFMLLSTAGLISLGVLDAATPRVSDPSQVVQPPPENKSDEPQLTLTVAISKKGLFIFGNGVEGLYDPMNIDINQPPTLPLKGQSYNFDGLTEKLLPIKRAFPKETRLILVAEPDIAYDIVIQVMDACRQTLLPAADGPQKLELFGEVWLTALSSAVR